MVASTGTARSAPSPFNLWDRVTAWWSGVKSRARRRYRRAVQKFQFWSAVAFWFVVIYYAGMKGWIF